MGDVRKDWQNLAPKGRVDTLSGLVRDFLWRYPDSRRDTVVEWCRQALTYSQAVERAVLSRNEKGTMHNHQTRVRASSMKALINFLLHERSNLYNIHIMSNFDKLHDCIEGAMIWGIGPVTVYDVAVRLGVWMGKEPTSVYMHAGVRLGAKAMGHPMANSKRIPLSEFPLPIRSRLKADLVEDFLCTYRCVLRPDMRI